MKIRAFTKSYGERTVLKTCEMELDPGKIYAAVGANGSGKSTFGKTLCGILRPDQELQVISERCTVSYMPQKSYAFHKSTLSNVLLGGRDVKQARRWMEVLDIWHLKDQPAGRLSGGETARMALARTLMRPADLLILDEPTAAMDVTSAYAAEQLILQYLHETGCTVLLISHHLHQVQRIADEILFFHQGAILEAGPAQQILKEPANEETRKFFAFYGFT